MANYNTRVLLLYGGWEGHTPALVADFAAQHAQNCEVVRAEDLAMLRTELLTTVPYRQHVLAERRGDACCVDAAPPGALS